MPPLETMDHAPSRTVVRQRHPHPGESIPDVAWPTLTLGAVALVVFVLSTAAAIGGHAPIWLTITVNTAVVYAMFMVAHDALHHSLSSASWVNSVFGRAAWLFVGPMFSLPAFSYVHLQHHRNANDGDNDPDLFASHAPAWQLPFRWALMDAFYAVWYCRQLKRRLQRGRRRPLAEVAETVVVFSLSAVGLGAATLTGNFWTIVIVLLIPQRIGMAILGWWFDWLPHHGLEQTQQENRYRATRNRVGMEWLLMPVMLSQTYHLVHHLHPWLPFYRYGQAWRSNEDAYLAQNPALSTVFGRELTPQEYREWKAG
ncbi:fatty acid desaturase [Mycolicibacter sp. MYC123]|uniref:Fatty acid desaturase n=1 Tax=[Mycobacterium] zoologicum TaxID=2872311 RepID=A0ABU5YHE2_9MYCO|nr:fatty acid desaturase [Mycolicibacter sp. MYC123]MEB3049467.1 fatty acid desaturase [Mycolicibacter sp. MYC123]